MEVAWLWVSKLLPCRPDLGPASLKFQRASQSPCAQRQREWSRSGQTRAREGRGGGHSLPAPSWSSCDASMTTRSNEWHELSVTAACEMSGWSVTLPQYLQMIGPWTAGIPPPSRGKAKDHDVHLPGTVTPSWLELELRVRLQFSLSAAQLQLGPGPTGGLSM